MWFDLKVGGFLFRDKDLSGTAGHCGGGHPGTVLGSDERQIALCLVGAVFSSFQFALEATDTCQVRLTDALL